MRQIPAGADVLSSQPRTVAGRFHRAGQVAFYLADCADTAWAEWYRWLAETGQPPLRHVPREVYEIEVDLADVADLRTERARKALGLPRLGPTRRQWPAYQDAGDRLRASGAPGILYASAARPRGTCLCVFESGLSGLRAVSRPELVRTPPPPRGLRT